MGYIKHHTIVVTGWQDEKIKEAHLKAKEVFEKNFEREPYEKPFASRLVSEIIQLIDKVVFLLLLMVQKKDGKLLIMAIMLEKNFLIGC